MNPKFVLPMDDLPTLKRLEEVQLNRTPRRGANLAGGVEGRQGPLQNLAFWGIFETF